jgi:hypothetical protein
MDLEGGRGRDAREPVGELDGDEPVVAGEGGGDPGDEVGGDRPPLEGGEVVEVEPAGEDPQDRLLREEVLREEDAIEGLAALRLRLEAVGDRPLVELPLFSEERGDAVSQVGPLSGGPGPRRPGGRPPALLT